MIRLNLNLHRPRWNVRAACVAATICFALVAFTSLAAYAQQYRVLHSFSNGADGAIPLGGMAIDATGTIYGVTHGELGTVGTVFRVKPHNGSWIFETLYTFSGGADGSTPATVVFGPDGALYGSTQSGGQGEGGVIFRLRPPPTPCKAVLCPWTETVLYSFVPDGVDASTPAGQLTFDASGAIYGTTLSGGGDPSCDGGCGAVFKLTPSGGHWTESVVYGFQRSGAAGWVPYSGVIVDSSGNLYGTTYDGPGTGCGGFGCGTVYELTPSGSGWNEQTLHRFQGSADGAQPIAGVVFDRSGNLLGATSEAGSGAGGTLFEISPSGGNRNFTLLQSLPSDNGSPCGPPWSLTMDQAGNFYGVTGCDTAPGGNAFKLTPSQGGWQYTDLHDFPEGNGGWDPWGGVVIDAAGNVYGTTEFGGNYSRGTVWEITP